jgi:PAS domain S-box-containing protein
MDPQAGTTALLATGVGIALVSAVLLLGVGLARARRGTRRFGERLADLRRHPLVGELPVDDDPAVADAAREVNALVDSLRSQVAKGQERAASLQALADGPADVALIGLDTEWLVNTFSRGATLLTGWPADEIAGQHVEALFTAGEWERLLPKLARRSLREEGFTEVVRLQPRRGAARTCRVSVGPGGGVPGGTLLVARDLGAEIELERKLRVSEERHRRLVEEVQDGVLVLQGGRIAYANPALAQMVGQERDALQGRSFKDLLDAHDLLRVLEIFARADQGVEPAGETTCRLAAPGRPPIDARLTWAATEFQGRRAVFATVADRTARAGYERRLVESEARLRATLEAAGDGLVVFGDGATGMTVTLLNAAFARLLGAEAGDLIGAASGAVLRRMTQDEVAAGEMARLLDAARAGQESRREGVTLAGPRGTIVDFGAAPIRARTGETFGVILTARDVTARVEQERALRTSVGELSAARQDQDRALQELAEARQALQERNTQLERLNSELRSLDEMKSNLLANVSHELHTPLVSIKGYTEMILKRKLGPLTPEQERGLQVAQKNIDRLIELIDNLLSFARLETGETQLTLEDIPLWQVVDEAVDLVSERIRRRGLSVTTQYESDDLMVRGDRVKIGQVFTNLLTNAVKFNREGGRIAVSARRGRAGFVDIEVSDTGIGIPAEEREKIFERFYQVEAGPRRRYEGTGIGLSIVRDILRLHGCSIQVQGTPGEGSTFQFTLPLARRPEPSEARPPQGRGRAHS